MPAVAESRTVVAGVTQTNTTITAPAGIVDGNVLIALIHTGSDPVRAITPPAGWTAITNFPLNMISHSGDPYIVRQHAYYKVASGESGNYTFNHSSAHVEAYLSRWSGVDTADIFNVLNVYTSTDPSANIGGTATAPTITPTVDGSGIIWWGNCWDGFGNTSPPTGTTPTFTERANDTSGVFYVADGVLTTAGATGAKSVTTAQPSNRPWLAGMICLKAAAAAAGGHIPFRRSRRRSPIWRM